MKVEPDVGDCTATAYSGCREEQDYSSLEASRGGYWKPVADTSHDAIGSLADGNPTVVIKVEPDVFDPTRMEQGHDCLAVSSGNSESHGDNPADGNPTIVIKAEPNVFEPKIMEQGHDSLAVLSGYSDSDGDNSDGNPTIVIKAEPNVIDPTMMEQGPDYSLVVSSGCSNNHSKNPADPLADVLIKAEPQEVQESPSQDPNPTSLNDNRQEIQNTGFGPADSSSDRYPVTEHNSIPAGTGSYCGPDQMYNSQHFAPQVVTAYPENSHPLHPLREERQGSPSQISGNISTSAPTSVVPTVACPREETYQCSTCGLHLSSKYHLMRHKKIHSGVKAFKCQFCQKAFFRSEGCKAHERTHTGARPYQCSFCNLSFTRSSGRLHHVKKHHSGNKPYCCTFCSETFATTEDRQFHEDLHSENDRFIKCDYCRVRLPDKESMELHMKTHRESRNFKCDRCGKECATIAGLRLHTENHPKMLKCETCGFECSQQKVLNDHMASHYKSGPNEGDQEEDNCRVLGDDGNSLGDGAENSEDACSSSLLSTRAGNGLFIGTIIHYCKECDKMYSSQRFLNQHMKLHLEKKRKLLPTSGVNSSSRLIPVRIRGKLKPFKCPTFKCSTCGLLLSSRNHLIRHERDTHDKIKAYKCNYCEKTFARSEGCRAHERWHTGVSPYKCDFCEETFPRPENLPVHVKKKHSGDKPYCCPFCPGMFASASDRDCHKNAHTDDERKVKCLFCPLTFPGMVELKEHEMTHKNSQQCKCYRCDKIFATFAGLQAHVKRHPKMLQCDRCSFECRLQSALREHMIVHFRPGSSADTQESLTYKQENVNMTEPSNTEQVDSATDAESLRGNLVIEQPQSMLQVQSSSHPETEQCSLNNQEHSRISLASNTGHNDSTIRDESSSIGSEIEQPYSRNQDHMRMPLSTMSNSEQVDQPIQNTSLLVSQRNAEVSITADVKHNKLASSKECQVDPSRVQQSTSRENSNMIASTEVSSHAYLARGEHQVLQRHSSSEYMFNQQKYVWSNEGSSNSNNAKRNFPQANCSRTQYGTLQYRVHAIQNSENPNFVMQSQHFDSNVSMLQPSMALGHSHMAISETSRGGSVRSDTILAGRLNVRGQGYHESVQTVVPHVIHRAPILPSVLRPAHSSYDPNDMERRKWTSHEAVMLSRKYASLQQQQMPWYHYTDLAHNSQNGIVHTHVPSNPSIVQSNPYLSSFQPPHHGDNIPMSHYESHCIPPAQTSNASQPAIHVPKFL